jgi:hypothetical protein
VIEHRNADDLARGRDVTREVDVLRARCLVAARMVVNEHERGGTDAKRVAERIRRADGCAVEAAFGDADGRAEMAASVERE